MNWLPIYVESRNHMSKSQTKGKGKSKPWWAFISHNGKRTSRKVRDKKASEAVASKIRAKLRKLGEFGFDDPKSAPTFKEHAKLWLS